MALLPQVEQASIEIAKTRRVAAALSRPSAGHYCADFVAD
jgi:hypothetical protein